MSQIYKKKVLIADDEPSIRLLVRKFLSKSYVVIEARDGKEAVAIARNERPDLVLMDLTMPKMNGYSSCHMIKTDQATKAIPVVMLTDVGHELNVQLSQKMDADGYITKPFASHDLLDTISELLSSSGISDGDQGDESS